MVEILHAEDHLAAAGARAEPGDGKGSDVAEMEGARRAGREPADIAAHCFFQKASQAAMN